MNCAPTPLVEVASVLRAHGLLRELRGSEDEVIEGVSQDSRDIQPRELFLAWVGTAHDAHGFVPVAERAGASGAVVEHTVEGVEIPQLVVTDGRRAAAVVAAHLAGDPAGSMFVAAATGTNGKTTTAWIARHLLDDAGAPAAALGTLGVVGPGGALDPEGPGLTSAGPVEVAETLRTLRQTGVRAVVLEASSHALDQRRLDGIRFDAAVFTNLSQDHLDYHETLDAYRTAKGRLVELLKDGGRVVVNAGEEAWGALPVPAEAGLTFRVAGAGDICEADLCAEGLALSPAASEFRLTAPGGRADVSLPFPAPYNVENALGAVGIGLVAGVPLDRLVERLRSVPQVPGRLEVVVREPFTVVIDFAHTPAALEGVLRALRSAVEGRLIVVFGAGGDRDRAKRPRMGAIVAELADLPVVTSDNPRTEDPESIVDEIVDGVGERRHLRIVDRREAIHAALEAARPGDTVLLAGKGHERTQTVGDAKLPFDERVIVREALGEAA